MANATEVGGSGALCVATRAETGGVELMTVVQGRVASRRTLIADGERRPVQQSGCTGWEQAKWSEDGYRVYLRSELTCEGGSRRVASGVLAMASAREWMDIQSIEAGGYPAVRAVRYQPTSAQVSAVAGVQVPEGIELALETGRTAAAQPLSVGDLSEASRELSAETLEMLLYERGGVFEVDAAKLTALANAGLPDRVIDLVVALAYPDVFNVNSAARMVGYRPESPTEEALANARNPRRTPVYGMFYDPFDPYGFGYNRYSYGYGNYSPFGWGNPYGWRSGQVIVIQQPSNGNSSETRATGRAVNGRGYTRTRVDAGSAGSSRSTPRTSSSPDR
ncbi:MAG: hypothetical protein L0271_03800, partial [Gemmatimonadetes bacterium]|nr:hypothetical protein [Gemmatimonadota bacterium]